MSSPGLPFSFLPLSRIFNTVDDPFQTTPIPLADTDRSQTDRGRETLSTTNSAKKHNFHLQLVQLSTANDLYHPPGSMLCMLLRGVTSMPPVTKCVSAVGCAMKGRIALAPRTPCISYAHELCRRIPYYLGELRLSCRGC